MKKKNEILFSERKERNRKRERREKF